MDILILLLASGLTLFFLRGFFVRLKKDKPALKQSQISQDRETAVEGPRLSAMSGLEKRIWYEEEISFIFKLIEDISLRLDKDEIARRIVHQVEQFLNTKSCVLILLEKDTEKLRIKHAVGVEQEIIRDLTLEKGESISGWVMQNNESWLVNKLENESWLKQINKEDYFRNSFISIALSTGKETLGVINACDKKTGEAFTKEDQKCLASVARIAAVAFQNVRLHEQMQENYLKTITALAATIDARDPYTRTHSENVTKYSLEIARQMRCSFLEIEMIRRAGLLHDIGKIGIRDEILLKPSKLTEEEFEQIKLHPQKGEAIIQSLPFLKEIAVLIRHHHERFDGRGYPDRLAGEDIELGARILAVADSFDAMNSDRPYRKRLPREIIINELKRNKGGQFDPQIIDSFLKVLEQDDNFAGSKNSA
ncbi:HD domain-containing phosphohydrolase [Candidatus Omnitrophota bacterium]